MSQAEFHEGLDKFLFGAKICANLNAYRAQELGKAYSAADKKDFPLILYYIKNVGDLANLLEEKFEELRETEEIPHRFFQSFDKQVNFLIDKTVTDYLIVNPLESGSIDELTVDEKIDIVNEKLTEANKDQKDNTDLSEDLVLTNRFTTQQIFLVHDHIAGFQAKKSGSGFHRKGTDNGIQNEEVIGYVSDAATSVGEFCMGSKGLIDKVYESLKMNNPCDEALPDFAKCVKQYQYQQFSGCEDFKDEQNQVACSQKLEKLYKEGDMQNQCDPYLIATDFDGFGNCVTSVLAYQPEAEL